jgi:tetratricopeptide (TPR) repeat protein
MTQGEALDIMKTGANVFLTGEPGSGKTHTLSAYIRWLTERGIEPSVTASTGVAAKQVVLDQKAENARKAGKYKEAIVALQEALKINPDNEVIKGRIESVMAELRKQMQSLYQEGILEESVGEVETAKSKWKRIIESSVPEEEYYKKSHIKLKKYGVM